VSQSIINSSTLNCFKNGFDSMKNTQMGFFMDYSQSAEPYCTCLDSWFDHMAPGIIGMYYSVIPNSTEEDQWQWGMKKCGVFHLGGIQSFQPLAQLHVALYLSICMLSFLVYL